MDRLINCTIARFLLCGGTAAFVNWLARIGLSLYLPFGLSVVVAYAVGMVVGFLLYRNVVWPHAAGYDWTSQVTRFVLVNLFGAAVVLACSFVLLQLITTPGFDRSLSEAIAHAMAIAIGAVFNFIGHKRLTFKPS